MDQPWENVGPVNCTRCAVACYPEQLENPYGDNPYGHDTGELWCEACIQSAGEAQEEADFADYHGGVGSDAMYANAERKG